MDQLELCLQSKDNLGWYELAKTYPLTEEMYYKYKDNIACHLLIQNLNRPTYSEQTTNLIVGKALKELHTCDICLLHSAMYGSCK
jgi:hypothetical protein